MIITAKDFNDFRAEVVNNIDKKIQKGSIKKELKDQLDKIILELQDNPAQVNEIIVDDTIRKLIDLILKLSDIPYSKIKEDNLQIIENINKQKKEAEQVYQDTIKTINNLKDLTRDEKAQKLKELNEIYKTDLEQANKSIDNARIIIDYIDNGYFYTSDLTNLNSLKLISLDLLKYFNENYFISVDCKGACIGSCLGASLAHL